MLPSHDRFHYSPITERPASVGVAPAALVNGECYEHCPQLLDAYRRAGAEFVAHGRTNGQHPIAMHDAGAAQFADMVVDSVDEMLEQSERQPLVCGIVVHTFIVGHPFRLRRFRRALERIAAVRDRLWITTPGAIAGFYAREVQGAPAAVAR
jgi:hypothetical protein